MTDPIEILLGPEESEILTDAGGSFLAVSLVPPGEDTPLRWTLVVVTPP